MLSGYPARDAPAYRAHDIPALSVRAANVVGAVHARRDEAASAVPALIGAGHSVIVHSLSGRSRRTRFPVSGSLTKTDRFQTSRPMYLSFCNMALSAEMASGHLATLGPVPTEPL